jgi:PAS domain S-box-containing protein
LGYEVADALGKNIFDYFWPEDLPRAQSRLAELVAAPGNTQRDEYRLRHKDGSCRFIESIGSNHLEDPAIGGIVFNYRDITKRKQVGQNSRNPPKTSGAFRRLVEVQETERRHLARELHDEIGQALTAIEMNLQAMLQSSCADALAPRLNASLEVVDRVLKQVRPAETCAVHARRFWFGAGIALCGIGRRRFPGCIEVRAESPEQRLDP